MHFHDNVLADGGRAAEQGDGDRVPVQQRLRGGVDQLISSVEQQGCVLGTSQHTPSEGIREVQPRGDEGSFGVRNTDRQASCDQRSGLVSVGPGQPGDIRAVGLGRVEYAETDTGLAAQDHNPVRLESLQRRSGLLRQLGGPVSRIGSYMVPASGPAASASANTSPEARLRTSSGLAIDLGRREVTVGDRAVNLTRSEFDLLVALARDPRRVMTRNERPCMSERAAALAPWRHT